MSGVIIQGNTITNSDKTQQSYSLSHLPAGTALTIQPSGILAVDGPVPFTGSSSASVSLSPSSVTLAPGASAKVVARFGQPTGLDLSTYPVYGGFIQITNAANGEVQHVSYHGVANSLKKKKR